MHFTKKDKSFANNVLSSINNIIQKTTPKTLIRIVRTPSPLHNHVIVYISSPQAALKKVNKKITN
jgi:hypothetical protein